MAAVNLSPWKYSLEGATEPLVLKGQVQAGATQAIKEGELCTFNETSGYWQPISAAADIKWVLAFANEEISALTAPSARYSTFVIPRPGDVFEIELAAAASIEIGHNYEPTGTNTQTATLDADGEAVFSSVGDSNYPPAAAYNGTTLLSASHGLFTMNPEFSYYKRIVRHDHLKVISITAATTLLEEWSGAVIHNTAATASYAITLPATAPIGTHYYFAIGSANALQIEDTAGTIAIKGGVQASSKYVSVTDEGDFIHLVSLGANTWIAISSISGADGDITVET